MSEPTGALERLTRIVTRRRAAVLSVIAAVTAVSLAALPGLEADPSPERLMTGIRDHAVGADRLRAHFGDTDLVVLLLVCADDVLRPEPLTYVHRLSRSLAALPGVERVDGLTLTPIPHRIDEPQGHGLTLDELELEDEQDESPTYASPDVLAAMAAIARAEPDRFPDGLSSVAEEAARISEGMLVEGDEVSEIQARALESALADAPLVNGRLVSADRGVALIAVRLARDAQDHAALSARVRSVDAVLAQHDPPGGVELITGGLPHLRTSIVDEMVDDQTVLVPATLVVCLVLLLLAFRWIPGAVLPLVAVGVTGVIVMGGMALFGQPLDILTNIVPALLITIGVSDSIHLLGRYRRELRDGSDRVAAAHRTVRRMAVACLLTSLTTAVGLGSLLVAETRMLQRFGVIASLGVLVAYVVTLTFLPAAMTAFSPPPRGDPRTPDRIERVVLAVTRPVLRHAWATLAVSAVLLVVCGCIASRVELGSRLTDHFDEEDEVRRAADIMDARLDGVRPLEVLVSSRERDRFRDPAVLGAIDRTARWFARQPGVRRVTTPADLIHETWSLLTGDPAVRERSFVSSEQVGGFLTLMAEREPDPLRSYLSADGRVLRFEARLEDIGAARTVGLIEALDRRLARELASAGASDLDVSMTGEAFKGSLGSGVVLHDLLGSLLTAVVVIFGMLLLLFRSVRLGLLSIPPNLLPLVAAMAWMSLRGIPLDIATVIIFSIGIGLAVDGTIHVLVRFREELQRHDGDVDAAVLESARGTGGAIAISSVTLALGFGVMLFSAFVPVRHFGELIAVTVIGCLVSTLVVLPALIVVSHRRRAAPTRGAAPLAAGRRAAPKHS